MDGFSAYLVVVVWRHGDVGLRAKQVEQLRVGEPEEGLLYLIEWLGTERRTPHPWVAHDLVVMGYPWVGRTVLGAESLDQVRQAFLGLTDPKLLDLFRAKSYVVVTLGDYDEVRREAVCLGLFT